MALVVAQWSVILGLRLRAIAMVHCSSPFTTLRSTAPKIVHPIVMVLRCASLRVPPLRSALLMSAYKARVVLDLTRRAKEPGLVLVPEAAEMAVTGERRQPFRYYPTVAIHWPKLAVRA